MNFTKNKTVDQVMAPITKALKGLEEVVTHQKTKAEVAAVGVAHHQLLKHNARAEAARAEKMLKTLSGFVDSSQ